MKWFTGEVDEYYQNKISEMQNEIEQLNSKIQKLERGLNVEVWDGKRAKFIPFRETPEVAKVLQDDQSTGQVQPTQP